MPLPVSGKSSAIRGGLLIAKPAGGLGNGAFSVNRTIVRPELPLDTARFSMLFAACASACPTPNSSSEATAAMAARFGQCPRFASVDRMALICVAPV